MLAQCVMFLHASHVTLAYYSSTQDVFFTVIKAIDHAIVILGLNCACVRVGIFSLNKADLWQCSVWPVIGCRI